MKIKYTGQYVKLSDSIEIVPDTEYEISNKVVALANDPEQKLDDNGTVFFQRQLEAIESQTYDVLYPDLEARECFPTFDFGGAGARTLTFRSFDRRGSAQVVNARATDFPKADISGREFSIPVKSIGVAYDYDVDEVEAARMTGLPLEARRAEAAKRGYEETVNEIAWNGRDGIRGFFSADNGVSQSALANKINKVTALEGVAMLHSIINGIFAQTKKIHKAEFMWMPVALYQYLSVTPMSSTIPNETMMSYLVRTSMYITSTDMIKPLNQLASTENSTNDYCIIIGQMMVAGKQTVRLREPLAMQFFPVQIHNLTYEVPARGRYAGVEVTYSGALQVWTNCWDDS